MARSVAFVLIVRDDTTVSLMRDERHSLFSAEGLSVARKSSFVAYPSLPHSFKSIDDTWDIMVHTVWNLQFLVPDISGELTYQFFSCFKPANNYQWDGYPTTIISSIIYQSCFTF